MTQELTPEEQAKIACMTPSAENGSCVVGKCDFCGQLKNDLLPVDVEHLDDLVCAYCDSCLEDDEEE
jgi:hypothetical protein